MRRLLTPGWLASHAVLVVSVAVMLWLAGWQLSRATGGNALSWGYALQWPVFAGFAVFIWGREVRRTLGGARDTGDDPPPGAPEGASGPPSRAARAPVVTRRAPAATAYDDRDDPELAAYNRYLAWLSANPGARPVDYPG